MSNRVSEVNTVTGIANPAAAAAACTPRARRRSEGNGVYEQHGRADEGRFGSVLQPSLH